MTNIVKIKVWKLVTAKLYLKMTTFSTFSKSQKMSFWPARAQKADHGAALGRLLAGYKSK